MNAPAPPRPTWTTGTTERIKTGTWRAAIPVYWSPPSPCRAACPVDGNIADWIGLARSGDLFGAWTTLTQNNPFPAIAGRVCHRPCESACNRAAYDEPLAVRALERYVGDAALAAGWRFPAVAQDLQRIAVVGGGPSGLSAAYHLRRRGWAVTIFEARAELGGLLRYGIPPYRLPRPVLDAEIDRVLALGIEVRHRTRIANAQQLSRLRLEFNAVYLAPGAEQQKQLAQLAPGTSWLMDSAAYLAAANAGTPPALGRRIAVIGGGSAAMDVARSALRAGHEVSVLALEPDSAMPAQAEEVIAARKEGIALHASTHLKSVSSNGALTLRCERVRMKGANPLDFAAIAGSDFTLQADAIVTAIGQDPDPAPFRELLELEGGLLATDVRHATNLSGVFAGGDVASRTRFVTQAIGMGREAAAQIDRWLMGDVSLAEPTQPAVPFEAINTFYHPRVARAADSDALSVDEALAESARCFSCGRCTLCDNCLRYCPDMAVRRIVGGYEIAAEYCKGCGLCVEECPTGSLAMREEWR
jgi:NADPH-dependent glutamate synthase beta subunit-like oxidoreductase/Pyruvate/2-oxoacid:ferredoxin oxidoreductase delta subunit